MDQKITFQPSESVTFHSLTEKQNVELLIKNGWEKPVIFKMKSTRPALFKMRPVYGLIPAGDQKKIRLLFKGFDTSSKPPCNRDRFTVVIAPAPDKCTDASRVWREGKAPQVTQMCVRKVLKILYNLPDDDADKKKKVIVEQSSQPSSAAPSPGNSAPVPAAPPAAVAVIRRSDEGYITARDVRTAMLPPGVPAVAAPVVPAAQPQVVPQAALPKAPVPAAVPVAAVVVPVAAAAPAPKPAVVAAAPVPVAVAPVAAVPAKKATPAKKKDEESSSETSSSSDED